MGPQGQPTHLHAVAGRGKGGRVTKAVNNGLNYLILAALALLILTMIGSAIARADDDPLSVYAPRLAAATVVTDAGETYVDRSQFTGPEWEEIAAAAALRDGLELIGGTVADLKDWPASPWVGNCSSTLYGERVLVTAAHCVSNGGTKSFTLGGETYRGRCDHHPSYRRNSTADWALCLLDRAVPPSVVLETAMKPTDYACASGKEFTLTGFGCQRWGGGIDGKFRVGTAPILSCPRGTNYDTVTKGRSALCSGDSGGGGYLRDLVSGLRRGVSVNSRSNTTDTSYHSTLSTAVAFDWALGWTVAKGVWACGVNVTAPAGRCNGMAPPPPPVPPLPERCKPAFDKVSLCLWGTPKRHAITEPDVCRQAVLVVGECELDAEQDAP